MGAVPKTALNMVCFSPKRFDIKILKEILRGGADKIRGFASNTAFVTAT